jgi:hypothetical protein
MEVLTAEQIADLVRKLHNRPELVLTPEFALELKGHLVLLFLVQALGHISRWELSEVMIILQEVGELAGRWLKERESIQR